jgi:site-specific DNA recombinase
MFRVVDYSRVSTEEEKQKNALQTQQQENEEFIKKQDNWVLVDRYIDEGKSATTIEGRNDFKRLLADIQQDKFDIVLIKIIDRGWRNSLDWKLFEKLLRTYKKQLFIRTRNAFYDYTNPVDRMATSFEAEFAEWSSINQSIKMNAAHQTRMEKGTVVTNGRIWGYNQIKDEARLEINESEAEVVRYVFDAYIQGKGFRIIVKELDAMGIKNLNGNPFALTTLKRMIRQEKYKGMLICGKKHFNFWTKEIEEIPEEKWQKHENAVPAIVSAEVWQKANDILANKRKEFGIEEKRKIAGYFNGTYTYSGKVKCGKCNRPYYHSVYINNKNREKSTRQWECKGYREFGVKSEKGCDNIKVKEHEMDDIVKQAIFDFWQNKDENVKKVISILEGILSNNQYQVSIDKLKNEQKKLEKKKEKLIELYADDLISKEDFKNRNDDYSSQLTKAKEEIEQAEIKNKEIVDKRERLLKFQEFFNEKLESKDNLNDKIINSFLKEVIVYPDYRIRIILNGNFEFVATKENNEYIISPNVSIVGQYWSHSEMTFARLRRIKPVVFTVEIYIQI